MSMVTIYIDGKPYKVDPHRNLLEVCLERGFNLPYFCWHPAMGSVGACRQCAVMQFKDENDTHGKLVMSCMTPASDGTHFSLEHPEAREMRREVIEWLMTNHPHDCPVCEEGGECHLQDMTVMSGHNYRRYRETKRTHRNQYLGPFISHEMNRCIACYRCVRFYQDYAGGKDLSVFAARSNVYFGRAEDGVLESEFSGNLVEVCPTGVFTDKTLSDSYSRKWDLQTAPSVCMHCGVGCNTSPGERYGRLKRIVNRYHGDINGYFICDRGRFGYGFVNREDRPATPMLRQGDSLQPVYKEEALQAIAPMLQGQRVLGVGSPRASLESNHALRKLVGSENFCDGLSTREHRLLGLVADIHARGMAHVPSLREAEQADAILVLGEDVANTAARLALTIRQATRQKAFELAEQAHIPRWQDAAVRTLAQQTRSPLFVLTPAATRLDEIAVATHRATPEVLARIAGTIVAALDPAAPAADGLHVGEQKLANQIAQALQEAERPLIVTGPGCGSAAIIRAAANVARALHHKTRPAMLCLTTPEANSLGVALFDAMPLDAVLDAAASGKVDTLVVLENDLFRRAPAEKVEAALSGVKQLIVLDHLDTPTLQRATAVLPVGSFAEADGTWVNYEGRAQRAYQVYAPDAEGPLADVQESWRWLQQLAGGELPAWPNLDAVAADCAGAVPALAGIVDAAPSAAFRRAGQKLARQPHRYSGRTAMRANISVHEPRPSSDEDSPLSFSMESIDGARFNQQGRLTDKALTGPDGNPPAEPKGNVVPLVWMPGWNSNQAVTKFQDEINGHLRGGDPGVRLFGDGLKSVNGDRPKPVPYLQPEAEAPTGDGLRVLPLYHIFGSEELSARSPPVAERMPANHVALNAQELKRLGVQPGESLRLGGTGEGVNLPAQLDDSLPDGTLGLPQGLPGMPVLVASHLRVEKA